MTPVDTDALRRLLADTTALLLDFDGPICSVFAGLSAPVVADQLRAVLTDGGHTDLPADVVSATDPFTVLFHAATVGPDEARYVDAAFRAHEVEAIHTAEPTPGAHELIDAWKSTGRPVAIVSNNSALAVAAYLDLYNLRQIVDHVSARTGPDVRLLKPSPHLVTDAVQALAAHPTSCTFVGDSVTDIEAAHAARVRSIGYANKPGKADLMTSAGPDAITDTMALARAVCVS